MNLFALASTGPPMSFPAGIPAITSRHVRPTVEPIEDHAAEVTVTI
jgi:hypothetical protein